MEDLIKRADAIKWFEPYADRGLKIPVETVIQNLKDIPSAEPKGEWIDENNNIVPFDKDGCPRGWCKCSKCGDYLSASDEYAVRGFFCPNCGARMVK